MGAGERFEAPLNTSKGLHPTTAVHDANIDEWMHLVRNYVYNGVIWVPLKGAVDGTALAKLTAGEETIGNVGIDQSVESILLQGTATDGSETMLIDSTKNFEADVLIGKVVKITIGGVDYYRKIAGSIGDSFIFPTILDPVAAFVVIGSGQDAEGQVTIRCQGDLDGETGNAYSVEIIQGVETTGDTIVTLEGTVLTITVNLDGLGDPRLLAAGDIQNLIANTVGVADKFIVDNEFVAGNLPIGGVATPFTMGADGIPVVAGTEYEIEVAQPTVEVNNFPATQDVALTGSIPQGENEIGKVQVSGSKVKRAYSVTPNDGADLPHPTVGIAVATDGNIKVLLIDDTEPVIIPAVAAGGFHPIEAKRIYATDTTATGIIASW